jgi:hypothetical protein
MEAPLIEEPSFEEVNLTLDQKILDLLRQQAIEYNTSHEDVEKIDLNRVKTKLELAISLWQRSVNTQPIFGEPFDTAFRRFEDRRYVTSVDDPIDPDNLPFIYSSLPIDKSNLIRLLDNSELIVGMLATNLAITPSRTFRITPYLEDESHDEIIPTVMTGYRKTIADNFTILNEILSQIKKPTLEYPWQFRVLLKTFTDIEIAYIAIETDRKELYTSEAGLALILHELFELPIE